MFKDRESLDLYVAAKIAESALEEEMPAGSVPEPLRELRPTPDGGTIVNGTYVPIPAHQILEANLNADDHGTNWHIRSERQIPRVNQTLLAAMTDALKMNPNLAPEANEVVFAVTNDTPPLEGALMLRPTAREGIIVFDNPSMPLVSLVHRQF